VISTGDPDERTMSMNRTSRRALLRGASAAGITATAALMLGPKGRVLAQETAATPAADGTGVIPDTEAGRAFAGWLSAFNSADVDQLRALHTIYTLAEEVEQYIAFDLMLGRERGTLQVYSVLSSTEQEIKSLVYATLSEDWAELTFQINPLMIQGLPGSPPADAADRVLTDEELGPEIDRYLRKLGAADVFSGAVLVARNGVTVYEGVAGLADQETGAANLIDTKFNLGSMNKMVTSVAVAQLVERGAFTYDSTLASLLPDYPNQEAAAQVTVHHLLTHTSGLGDIFTPEFFDDVDRYREPEDYFALFADKSLRFTPGDRFEYSNAGFVVLGAIVARVSGEDYYTYVREHVYGPAGMTNTDSYERDATVPNLATGYMIPLPDSPRDLTPEIALSPRQSNIDTLGFKGSPAGGGYSTVQDLARFHTALWGHTFVGAELTERITTGVVDAPFGPGVKYGYGFMDDRSGEVRIVGHGGGAPGINANLDMYPDLGLAVAVLSNYDGAAQIVAMRLRRMVG
jgi:CubicO group peptidase (beta-lactamase class C family)